MFKFSIGKIFSVDTNIKNLKKKSNFSLFKVEKLKQRNKEIIKSHRLKLKVLDTKKSTEQRLNKSRKEDICEAFAALRVMELSVAARD